MTFETVFTMDTSSIKYGPGVTRESGFDMEGQGCRRVMVVTDPYLSDSGPVAAAPVTAGTGLSGLSAANTGIALKDPTAGMVRVADMRIV